MAESQSAAASSGKVPLPNTLDLTADVPNWSVAEYGAGSSRLMDVHRFAEVCLDGRSKMMTDRRGLQHMKEIDGWDRR